MCIRDRYDYLPQLVHGAQARRRRRRIPGEVEKKDYLSVFVVGDLVCMAEQKMPSPKSKSNYAIFFNCKGDKLTRQGITYILQKYTTIIGLENVTPHLIRHSKAMHLTEADINPVYIRDFLGHTDLKVTQIYSKTSVEMKRKALEKLTVDNSPIPKNNKKSKDWNDDKNLIDWLNSLGH